MLNKFTRVFNSKDRRKEIDRKRDDYLLSMAHGYATMTEWIDQEENEDYILNNTAEKVQERLGK